MFNRLRAIPGLLLALTFGATSAAPGLFHRCDAGREMAAQLLQQTAAAQPSAHCAHHSGSSHRSPHAPYRDCDCLGHACCSTAVAHASARVTPAIAVARTFVATVPTSPDTPLSGARHGTPATRAPPTTLA